MAPGVGVVVLDRPLGVLLILPLVDSFPVSLRIELINRPHAGSKAWPITRSSASWRLSRRNTRYTAQQQLGSSLSLPLVDSFPDGLCAVLLDGG
jgi:hypothetical protein